VMQTHAERANRSIAPPRHAHRGYDTSTGPLIGPSARKTRLTPEARRTATAEPWSVPAFSRSGRGRAAIQRST
jgi:hypothetical protein